MKKTDYLLSLSLVIPSTELRINDKVIARVLGEEIGVPVKSDLISHAY